MAIEAKIIADSKTFLHSKRATTFVLRYPRFIHSELMTHRMFARNASSSRAIPLKTMIKQVQEDPAMPVYWGKNQKGMQAKEELCDLDKEFAKGVWTDARDKAVEEALRFAQLGVHKQIANRILEPWMHISVVMTGTEWANFFTLRTHHDAQPEFRQLALQMYEAYCNSKPTALLNDEWHLPFVSALEVASMPIENAIKLSVARSARVSYLRHDGTPAPMEEDFALHDDLVVSKPLHASPAEHQLTPHPDPMHRSGCMIGFVQYRKTLLDENINEFPLIPITFDQARKTSIEKYDDAYKALSEQ